MENNESQVQQTNIQISKITKNEEILKRLQSEEAQKARNLLATAMSHLEAHKIVRNSIIKKMNGSYGSKK
jgi:hypothetical protein